MRAMQQPVFVVAPPRSGSALVVESLGLIDVSTAFDELLAAHEVATAELAAALRQSLPAEARAISASPHNMRRVPLLSAVFPEATFVYIYRDPRRALHELHAPDTATLAEHAREWAASTSRLLDELEALPPNRWMVVAYGQLVDDPATAIARIASFAGVTWNGTSPARPNITEPAPSAETIAALEATEEITRDVAARARNFFAAPPPRAAPTRERAARMREDGDPAPFRSVSTQSLPDLLHRLGITLVVSTYQSGRLIFIRAENATTLNTHFRMFRSPMGIAASAGQLTIGTEREVWDYRNQPAVAEKLEPAGKHDACFVPRRMHVTGDIRIHEIGYAAGELWIVNTRFSTLCTLNDDNSFVPRWRPPFVTHLSADDRCHLNGMAIVDDRVRYVTAFGATNTAGGWREHKAAGGLLLDVDSGELLLRGLSMPHSPRQHGDRFFVLESGKGTLATADLRSGEIETIAELPGFTRGLAFAGNVAFVGLSQVRESNIFGGIPLTERVAERQCGVYAIDLRNGQTIAFLRFEGDVQEIFDVQVLHGIRYPELLELTSPLISTSFTVPDDSLPQFVTRSA
jgi:uncharacterized protein (TIGR03032 family)